MKSVFVVYLIQMYFKTCKIFLIIFCIGIAGFLCTSNFVYSSAVIDKGAANLVGYWPFNERSGTVATDFSGKGNNGILVSSPSWVTGKYSNGLNFNGTTQYVNVSDKTSWNFGTGGFTISAWIKTSSATAQTVYGRQDDSNSHNPMTLLSLDSSGHILISLRGTEAVFYQITGTKVIKDGKWHHVLMTSTGSGGTLFGYVDGVQDVSTALAATTINFGSAPATIGVYDQNWVSSLNNFFNGSIDDVRIYNRSLSAAEISSLYVTGASQVQVSQNTRLNTGLVAIWSFDGLDLNSTTAFDRSGGGNDGTLTNTPVVSSGKLGQALAFNGSSNYVDAGTSAALRPSTFTISAWIYPTGASASIYEPIISNNVFADYYGYFLAVNNNLQLYGGVQSSSATSYTNLSNANGGYQLSTNKWYHVLLTYDSSALTLYVNGVQAGQKTSPVAIAYEAGDRFRVGTWAGTPPAGGYFNGKVDDVRVYNRVLSTTEIKQVAGLGNATSQTSQNSRYRTGLQGLWSFDGLDLNTSTSTDRSGNANDGTLKNSPSPAAGKIGQGLQFLSANSQYIDMGNPASLQLTTQGTLSIWFKLLAYPPTGAYAALPFINKGQNFDNLPNGYSLSFINYNGGCGGATRQLRMDTGNGTSYGAGVKCTDLPLQKWYHLVGTWDGVNNKLYLNGVNVNITAVTVAPANTSNSFLIGGMRGANNTTVSEFASAVLDDARVYNRALSAAEINQLYILGK